jgi:hypothetical protein
MTDADPEFIKGPKLATFKAAAAVYIEAITAGMVATGAIPLPEMLLHGVMDFALQALASHSEERAASAAPFIEATSQTVAMTLLRTEDPNESLQQFVNMLMADITNLHASMAAAKQ